MEVIIMSTTDFIALLAFFISLYGAILSTYTAINEFFRLELSIINQDKSFITFTKSDKYLDECGEYLSIYKKNFYTIGILVRIVNKSKNPTTINEIVLNDKYKLNSSSSIDDIIPTQFEAIDNSFIEHASKNFDYPIIKPLYEVKPLDTVEGYLIFNDIEEIPSQFNVKINTVQKSKTFHLNLVIPNDYRNEQI
jgi:hypothetical protein